MQRQVVELERGPVEYVDTGGSGPTVVLLHGALMDDRLWWQVMDRLAPGVRCVVPVLPMGAHARPMPGTTDVSPSGLAELVADFLAALDLTDPILVGNDTGGALAQLVAANHPDALGGLVLVSCDAFDNFPPGLPGRTMALACAFPGGLRLAMATLRLRPLRRLPMTFGWMTKRPIADDVFRAWLDAYAASPRVRSDVRRMMRGVDRRQLVEAAERLRTFEAPSLVVWAREDRVMPVAHAERLAAILPNSRLELVDDSYTLVPLDRPAALADLIADFTKNTTRVRNHR